MRYSQSTGALAVLILSVGSLALASASPQAALGSMAGFWMGPGSIEFEQGASEALMCKAYYGTQDHARRLSIVLRCASRSNRIELRAKLALDGSRLTGTWEERTFNAQGTATGEVKEHEITMTVDGGGFTATMLVTQEGGYQNVAITTQGTGFKKVNVSLSRGEDDD